MGTNRKPNRDERFCWFCCFQPYSRLRAVRAITAHIQATDLTTALGHIMEEAQSWSPLAIARTTAVPDTGMVACTTFGGLVTGPGGMDSKCGSAAITLHEDTKAIPWVATSAGYQAVTSPPSKPRKAPTIVSERSWRFR
jgi:hypothetical protein